jgi:hypothetical protein
VRKVRKWLVYIYIYILYTRLGEQISSGGFASQSHTMEMGDAAMSGPNRKHPYSWQHGETLHQERA